MSASQCRKGRLDRDSNIALNGENGHRLFRLAADTGVPVSIHLEPEDESVIALEKILNAYPGANVIVAHFGQIRHPEVQRNFTPQAVRRLLSTYHNLYYDLATGYPNRQYNCSGPSNDSVLSGDTVLWKYLGDRQAEKITAEWQDILTSYSEGFVFATDYGGGRSSLSDFLHRKVSKINLIISELPEPAQHDIAYRNAWQLITGHPWK